MTSLDAQRAKNVPTGIYRAEIDSKRYSFLDISKQIVGESSNRFEAANSIKNKNKNPTAEGLGMWLIFVQKRRKKLKKKSEANSTQCSQAVTHPSTD